MTKTLIFLLLIYFISVPYNVSAKKVEKQKAELAGKNFYYERINQKKAVDYNSIIISSTIVKERNSEPLLYIFNIKNSGYVIVSADDAAIPVVAYSFSEEIDMENPPPAFNEWIEGYADQIEEIRTMGLVATTETDSFWNALTMPPAKQKKLLLNSVDPLLISNWDQGKGYNELCPADAAGPGGKVYAGCVAVAMAQIMYYYKYPDMGNGMHTYYSPYGPLTANFGTSQYKWNEMVNKMPYEGNYEVAKLLYHCGVSVNMNYSPNGSGAWPNRCVSAYKNYFRYGNSVIIQNKADFGANQWINKIKQSLNDKIPLFYHGYPTTGGGAGHAFNLDGYQGTAYFHFNWGWSGHYNGYFYLGNLNPGGSDFSGGQGAIFGIEPQSIAYPLYCSSKKTITSRNGIIFDGSGPEDYHNNSDCYWQISPSILVDRIKLSFDKIELDSGDYVYIYDGTTTSASLLGKYTGTNLPAAVTSTGPNMLVRFKTNSNGTNEGFHASYKSIMPVYCQGTLTVTGPSGIISDGSGSNDYNNRTICRWMIDGQGQMGIKLNFSEFKTEPNKDWVKIYDPTQSPSVLLAAYSGHQIPPSVSSSSGKMLIIFMTGQSGTDQGWKAHYYVGSVGMEEIQSADIKIYPNPATSVLNISFTGSTVKYANIKLYGIDGKLLIDRNIKNTNSTKLDISKIKAGFYFITIRFEDKIIRKKIEISI